MKGAAQIQDTVNGNEGGRLASTERREKEERGAQFNWRKRELEKRREEDRTTRV